MSVGKLTSSQALHGTLRNSGQAGRDIVLGGGIVAMSGENQCFQEYGDLEDCATSPSSLQRCSFRFRLKVAA